MAEEVVLIELVRAHALLYDTSHPDYTRTKLKDEIWNKIGAELASDGKTVKEQWLKLRERHREALRRQKIKKKSKGFKAEFLRPWSYQQQMEFLIPYMKSRPTYTNINAIGNGEIRIEEIVPKLEQEDPEVGSYNLESQSDSESPTPKRSKIIYESGYLPNIPLPSDLKPQTSEMRATNHDELKKTIIQREQASVALVNDALFQFFMSMYNITKNLSGKHQRHIRNKVYEAVSQAEEENELEITTRMTSFSPSFSEGSGNSSSSSAMF